MTLIYLVRHGETNWNRERRIQGSTDIPLNDTGRAQARATGELLARRQWTAIVASPLSRALETAQIIAAELGLDEPTTLEAIVERNYGGSEGLTGQQIDARFGGGRPFPEPEPREAVVARALPALIDLAEANPGGAIVVVAHGGVIRAVLNAVAPHAAHEQITNGSIHSFRHVDGSLELIAFDDPIDVESLEFASDDIDDQNAIEHQDSARSL
jgi:uncharacterized phosphatase